MTELHCTGTRKDGALCNKLLKQVHRGLLILCDEGAIEDVCPKCGNRYRFDYQPLRIETGTVKA